MSKYVTEYTKSFAKKLAYYAKTGNQCQPSDRCVYCDNLRAVVELMKEPTLFQAQLARAGACFEGLIGVGKMNARTFYNTTDRADWLEWLWDNFTFEGGGVCQYNESKSCYYTADEFRTRWSFNMLREASIRKNGRYPTSIRYVLGSPGCYRPRSQHRSLQRRALSRLQSRTWTVQGLRRLDGVCCSLRS